MLTGSACGPMVERAPFSVRPDAIERGDLLGPFDGLVVDAETGRPVPGAVVEASWAFERGVGTTDPFGARDLLIETEADGRYRVPRLDRLPTGLSTRVRRFTLIVYKRGYVGWRSDSMFPTGARRPDFSQRGNRARLTKWSDELPHSRHLVFLGGGPAVQDAARWEVQLATAELDGRGPKPGEQTAEGAEAPTAVKDARLDVTSVLSEDEVRAVTGYSGTLQAGRLADLPRTEFYDTLHFKAAGKPETHDVAVRIWRLGSSAAEEQYRKIVAELPQAAATREIGDSAVEAQSAGVRALVFLARERGTVVSVTCGNAQCTEPAQVLKIGKLIEGRLDELEKKAAPRPAEGAPAEGVPSAVPGAAP